MTCIWMINISWQQFQSHEPISYEAILELPRTLILHISNIFRNTSDQKRFWKLHVKLLLEALLLGVIRLLTPAMIYVLRFTDVWNYLTKRCLYVSFFTDIFLPNSAYIVIHLASMPCFAILFVLNRFQQNQWLKVLCMTTVSAVHASKVWDFPSLYKKGQPVAVYLRPAKNISDPWKKYSSNVGAHLW